MLTSLQVVRIEDWSSLEQLTDSEFRRRWRRAQIVLAVPGMESRMRLKLEGTLTRLYNECGCRAGGAFFVAGLLASGGILWAWPGAFNWLMLAGAFAGTLALAAVAKATGIIRARRKLLRLVEKIEKLRASPRPLPETGEHEDNEVPAST